MWDESESLEGKYNSIIGDCKIKVVDVQECNYRTVYTDDDPVYHDNSSRTVDLSPTIPEDWKFSDLIYSVDDHDNWDCCSGTPSIVGFLRQSVSNPRLPGLVCICWLCLTDVEMEYKLPRLI